MIGRLFETETAFDLDVSMVDETVDRVGRWRWRWRYREADGEKRRGGTVGKLPMQSGSEQVLSWRECERESPASSAPPDKD